MTTFGAPWPWIHVYILDTCVPLVIWIETYMYLIDLYLHTFILHILSVGAVDLRCGGVRALARPCSPPHLRLTAPTDKICNVNVCGYRSVQYLCFSTNHQGYTGVQHVSRHESVVTWLQFCSLKCADQRVIGPGIVSKRYRKWLDIEKCHNLRNIRGHDFLTGSPSRKLQLWKSPNGVAAIKLVQK